MYGDFFAPPRQTPEERAKAMRELERSGKGAKAGKKGGKEKGAKKESKKSKKGKRNAAVSDDEDEDVEDGEEDEEEAEGGRDVMSRVKGDLFDSDDEQEEQGTSAIRSTSPAPLRSPNPSALVCTTFRPDPLSLPLVNAKKASADKQSCRRTRNGSSRSKSRSRSSRARRSAPRTGSSWARPLPAPGRKTRCSSKTSTLSTRARSCRP